MKHTILFLAAHPLATDRLALDREARAIQVALERGSFRDNFELVTRWAAEPLDLLRELRKLKPTVVHFSGHSSPHVAGAHDDRVVVDPPPQHGLLFQGHDGRPQPVSAASLEDVFDAAGSSVKLVVLNACYNELQAAALLSRVDCVVGMRGSIHDDAARSFAIGFYGGLAERESVAAAYKQGCAAIGLERVADVDRPQLETRRDADATRLILASASPASRPAADIGTTPRDAMLALLSRLLPSQFEMVLFRARIPMEHLSGASAPQAARAMEAIRYLEQQGEIPQLSAIVQEVAAAGPQ